MRRILDTQRAWIDGGRVLAYRTALELDLLKHHPDAARRDAAQRWCSLVTPVHQGRLHAPGVPRRQRMPAGVRRPRLRARMGHRADRARRARGHDLRGHQRDPGDRPAGAQGAGRRRRRPAALLNELRDDLDPSHAADALALRHFAALGELTLRTGRGRRRRQSRWPSGSPTTTCAPLAAGAAGLGLVAHRSRARPRDAELASALAGRCAGPAPLGAARVRHARGHHADALHCQPGRTVRYLATG